jgi:hypothetical protein
MHPSASHDFQPGLNEGACLRTLLQYPARLREESLWRAELLERRRRVGLWRGKALGGLDGNNTGGLDGNNTGSLSNGPCLHD